MFYTCPRCGNQFDLPKNACPACGNPVPEVAVLTTTAWESSKGALNKWKRIRSILTVALVILLVAAFASPSMDREESKDVPIPHQAYSRSLPAGTYCVAEIQANSIEEYVTIEEIEINERFPSQNQKRNVLYCYAKLADGSTIMISFGEGFLEYLQTLRGQEGTITIGGEIVSTPHITPGMSSVLDPSGTGDVSELYEAEKEIIDLIEKEMDNYTILNTNFQVKPEATERIYEKTSYMGTYLSYACWALFAILLLARMMYSKKINHLTQRVDFLLRQIPPRA